MKQSTCSAVICQPGGDELKHDSVLHSRPIFYAVRLYVMTKTDGGCLNE